MAHQQRASKNGGITGVVSPTVTNSLVAEASRTVVLADVYPNAEVKAEPKRRRLTAEYKLRILKEAETCREPGAIGALVRREGLYSSALTQWRKQRDRGMLSALSRKRGRKATNPLILENEALKKQNGKLEHRLKQAELIIEVQKKVSQLLGIPMSEPAIEGAE